MGAMPSRLRAAVAQTIQNFIFGSPRRFRTAQYHYVVEVTSVLHACYGLSWRAARGAVGFQHLARQV